LIKSLFSIFIHDSFFQSFASLLSCFIFFFYISVLSSLFISCSKEAWQEEMVVTAEATSWARAVGLTGLHGGGAVTAGCVGDRRRGAILMAAGCG
jgi:hypothetical protein